MSSRGPVVGMTDAIVSTLTTSSFARCRSARAAGGCPLPEKRSFRNCRRVCATAKASRAFAITSARPLSFWNLVTEAHSHRYG